MVTIYFVRNGSKIRVEVPVNTTLMEAARFYANPAIDEIPASCGGCCACATCHIKIDETWIDRIGKLDESTSEGALIEYEKGFDPSVSRLGCQIQLNKEHDGLIVHLLDNYKI